MPNGKEHRIVSGHLAGGAIGPTIPDDQAGGYRFDLEEIEYLHRISGRWVGMIGADYCAGWIKCANPLEGTMYYKDLNRGLIDYWNAGGLVIITTHPYPKKVFGCVEFNVRFDKKQHSFLDITRDYDYRPKFRWMRDHLPYNSFFMSWDRLSGPYARGTVESVKAMYNDPAVANRGDIDWQVVELP